MGRKKKEFKMSKDDIGYQEAIEEVYFSYDVPEINENTLASFSFGGENSFDKREEEAPIILNDNSIKKFPSGVTPPKDDEAFDIRRTYCMRKSTIIKLNQIKALSYDYNLFVSTIVDDAICYYHNLLMKK